MKTTTRQIPHVASTLVAVAIFALDLYAQEPGLVPLDPPSVDSLKSLVANVIRPFTIEDIARIAQELKDESGYFGMRGESRPRVSKYDTTLVVRLSAYDGSDPLIQVVNEIQEETYSFVKLSNYDVNGAVSSLPFSTVVVVCPRVEALPHDTTRDILLTEAREEGTWSGVFVRENGKWHNKNEQ